MDEKFLQSQEAHALLTSPALKRAVEGARTRIVSAWANELDPAKRDSLWHMLKALEQVTVALTTDASAAMQEEAKTKAERPR
jgi:hypothetical protein